MTRSILRPSSAQRAPRHGRHGWLLHLLPSVAVTSLALGCTSSKEPWSSSAAALSTDTSYTACADESGYCAFSGTASVRYGVEGSYTYKTLSDGTPCTNDVFGDPAFGIKKACAFSVASACGGPTPVTPTPAGLEKGFATSYLLQNYANAALLDAALSDFQSMGVGWLRMDFQWQSISSSSLDAHDTTAQDAVVKAAVAKGIRVLGLIDYSNQLANGGQDQMHPPDLGLFASYAAFLASHFGPMGVKNWEVWNEENTQTYWQPGVDSTYFKNLLAQTYPAIKGADPAAFVVLGGFAPTSDDGHNQTAQTFLAGLYAAGAKPYFDAVAMHPYTYTGDTYWFTNGVPALRQIMIDNGDAAKKIWLTEVGSPSSSSDPKYTDAWQASVLDTDFTLYKTYDYLGPIFIYNYVDPGNNPADPEANFGVVRQDGSHKPAYDVVKNAR